MCSKSGQLYLLLTEEGCIETQGGYFKNGIYCSGMAILDSAPKADKIF